MHRRCETVTFTIQNRLLPFCRTVKLPISYIDFVHDDVKPMPLNYDGSHLKRIALLVPSTPGTFTRYECLIQHLVARKMRVVSIDMPGFGDSLMPWKYTYLWNNSAFYRTKFLAAFINKVFGVIKEPMRIGCIITDEDTAIVGSLLGEQFDLYPFHSFVAFNPSYRCFISNRRRLWFMTMNSRSVLTRWWLPSVDARRHPNLPQYIVDMDSTQKFYTYLNWMLRDGYKPHISRIVHNLTIQNVPCSVFVAERDHYLEYDAINMFADALECSTIDRHSSAKASSKRNQYKFNCSANEIFTDSRYLPEIAELIALGGR